jgi:hypothetical protein
MKFDRKILRPHVGSGGVFHSRWHSSFGLTFDIEQSIFPLPLAAGTAHSSVKEGWAFLRIVRSS